MNRLIPIAIAVFIISGCATFSRGPERDTEAELKQAYKNCLTQAGNDSRMCSQEKDRLLQEQEWEMLDEST